MIDTNYQAPIAIHPGKTLLETIESTGITQAELALRMGLTPKTVNEIIKGKSIITQETALKLGAVFGTSANFWNNLQRLYDEAVVRLKREEYFNKEVKFLKHFTCYRELVQWKYVNESKTRVDKVNNLLSFFGVSSLANIPEVQPVAYRKVKMGKISNECLAAWIRCGELDVKQLKTEPFDREKLQSAINSLRSVIRKEPSIFTKELVNICASCGVAVAFVPYFKNTCVNGIAKWLNSNKAFIQVNLRGSCEDIFWFTFFHELGHVLKHGKKDQFIEFRDESLKDQEIKEKEANEFASNVLIPKSEYSLFVRRGDFSDPAIKKFAEEINILPSIVAGRLSRDYSDWKKWNHLRSRLVFKNNERS